MQHDLSQLAGEVIGAVKGYVERAMAALSPRVDALEQKLATLPEPKDGKDADIADLIPVMEAEVAKRVAEIPAPEPGKSVTPDDVAPMLRELVIEAVAALPPAKDGKDADPEHVATLVAEAVAALPAPKDGTSVTLDDVRPILDEVAAEAITQAKGAAEAVAERVAAKLVSEIPVPKDGEDGKSVQLEDVLRAMDAKMADWVIGFERHAQGVLERAAERIPKPADGKDGLGFDDMTVSDDGLGNVTMRWERGDQVKEHTVRLPVIVDCGVFTEGEYTRGSAVTFGGSLWIAQKDSPEGKPGLSPDWRLAVKRGRDGKDADVPPVPRGPVKLK
jgi:hypothetical protein